MTESNKFIFPGSSIITMYLSIAIVVTFELSLITMSMFSKYWQAFVVTWVIILLIAYVASKIIVNVEFNQNNIVVKYLFQNKRKVEYNHITKVYKHMELPVYVYIVKLDKASNVRKANFFCEKEEYEQVKKFIMSRNPSIDFD